MAQTDNFSIGTVSRLTGISQHTLRVWERRYEAVRSRRSEGGRRLYSSEDVDRLTLLKALVDRGDRIGQIAGEDTETLRARLASHEDHRAVTSRLATGVLNLAIYGETLSASLREDPLPGTRVTLAETDLERLQADSSLAAVDALILEFPLVEPDTPDVVADLRRAARTEQVVVVYGFGRTADVERLVAAGAQVLRAPAERHAISGLLGLPAVSGETAEEVEPATAPPISTDAQEIPPRRLSPQALQRLARVTTTVECECPHHLVDLVRSLTAFEVYSRQCSNRNEDDAALHAYLHVTTARARALMEEACIRAARADGIEI